MSLSSDRDEREIDEYHDKSNGSGSSSCNSGSTDEQYSFGVPRIPLEVLQKELRQKTAFGSFTGLSPSIPSPSKEEDILYCYAIGIPSEIEEKRLYSLRSKYQILDELIPILLLLVNGVVLQTQGLLYMRLIY